MQQLRRTSPSHPQPKQRGRRNQVVFGVGLGLVLLEGSARAQQNSPPSDLPSSDTAGADEGSAGPQLPDAAAPDPVVEDELLSSSETIVVVGEAWTGTELVDRGFLVGSRDLSTRLELQDEHPNDTLELFSKTPGVSLSRYGQGVINTDVAIRGFAGDGTTPHAKLMIDGIPSHLHNGYGELDQLFPMGIASIETFKGTSDVRTGRYNTAGNYYVSSRTDKATELQATYGSFNSIDAQAYSGHELGPVTQNLFAGYRQSNGFRDNGEVRKYAVSGRWAVDVAEQGTLSAIARLSDYEGDSPGYLPADEARADRRSSAPFANQDGGEKQIQHLSLHYDQLLLDDAVEVSAKVYGQTFERMRWVRFSEAGSLQERFDDQKQAGLVTTVKYLPGDNWNVSFGLDMQHEDVIEQRFGTVGQARVRDPENVIRNFDYDLQTYGGFLSVEHLLFERLRWGVGLRADSFAGDFQSVDAEGNTATVDAVDFGIILQPKVNLSVDVVPGVIAFANYGRSFQSPFGSQLYAVPDAVRSSKVSVNDGWEAGARYMGPYGLDVRVSYWQQLASNEFVSLDGVDQNVGETHRSGLETTLRWTPRSDLLVWGNLGWTRSEIRNPGDMAMDTIGNRLRGVPDFTTSFGARYDLLQNFFVSTHFDGQGSYFVNEMNLGGTYGDYFIANAEAGWQNKKNRIQLQGNNLFNSYLEYVFDFSADGTATIHAPGAGLNANLSYTRLF